MSTIKDFKNAPIGATATHALWSRAMKIDDGEQCWFTPGGNRYNNGGMVFWNYTLDAPAPTSAREALDLAWDLAHEVKEGQDIPKGTRFLTSSESAVREYIAAVDFKIRPGRAHLVRTLEPLPEPEPDWLDAPAVLARLDEWDRDELDVFTPAHEGEGHWVAMFSALTYHWPELRDVTPLYPKGQVQ